ncbi:MAG TPA: hypothetical protein VFL92_00890 [Sphingomonas sp.]|nr:hypothetical protein [Sphingomonas sp.]
MSGIAPRVHWCDHGGDEPIPILQWGDGNGLQLLIIQPLFEEMNRCRALVVALCRALAGHGFTCWLPDLPGAGESARPVETVGWEDWLSAVEAAARLSGATASIAIRGGALFDGGFARRWRFAPAAGASLLNDLRRSALVGGGDPAALAGYPLAPDFAANLSEQSPADLPHTRTLRLVSDDLPADRSIDAAPLWRRPEPQSDPALADLLAADIRAWIVS